MGKQPIGPVTPEYQDFEDSKIKERVGNCEKEVILNTSEMPNDEQEKNQYV